MSRTNSLPFGAALVTLPAMMKKSGRAEELKEILEGLYRKYNHKKFIPPDPLQFVYKYAGAADMEIAGFLAASFAYGSAVQIQKFLESLLIPMGRSPAEFIANFAAGDKKHFRNLKYRFNSASDIVAVIGILKGVLNSFGSLERAFIAGYDKNDETIIPALSAFCIALLGQSLNPSRGLKYLIVSPANLSSCKRMFLFLRWMVRSDNIDSGLWQAVDKSKLIVPVDVHMGRLSRICGLHSRKSYNLKTSLEITDGFRAICPGDPVRYDFALCRIGILENCTGKRNAYCKGCELAGLCQLKSR